MSGIVPRTCIGCGRVLDKNTLLRVVKNKEGIFSIDEKKSMSGRGAYICNSAECIEKAAKKKGLDRSFKMSVPAEVYKKLTEYVTG